MTNEEKKMPMEIHVSFLETVKQWSEDGYRPHAWPCVFKSKRDGAEKYHHDDKYRALEAENKRLRETHVLVPRELVVAAQDVCQAMTGSADQEMKIKRLREIGMEWNNTDNISGKP